jgi:DNA topoisomerase-1
VGRDSSGRKQYRYHEKWRAHRDSNKYERMIDFARCLPRMRERIARDLRRRGYGQERVLATVVRLMECTNIRIGNDIYAKQNKSYGLTTLKNHHVKVRGPKISIEFRGKSGVEHAIDLTDPRLAPIIRGCQDLPGRELFGYVTEDGVTRDVKSDDVNAYIREISGRDFTAKDFRTWAGTVCAARALATMSPGETKAQRNRVLARAIDTVAEKLGNTRAVCRKSYIHPCIFESFEQSALADLKNLRCPEAMRNPSNRLRPDEAEVLSLLVQYSSAGERGLPSRRAA